MSRVTRTDDITRTLREEVLRGRFREGERLPSERELAARFHTTRGVARVALKKLEQLGVCSVAAGGARVQPVNEASLDVIGHLLALETPPDPILVDQVLEVVGALVAGNVRMTIERAEPDALAPAKALLEELRDPELAPEDRHRILHDFGDAIMDANDNVVMQIVRRGLHTELFEPLEEVRSLLGPIDHEIAPYATALSRAIRERDGLAAYEAAHNLWSLFRRDVRRALEVVRERHTALVGSELGEVS